MSASTTIAIPDNGAAGARSAAYPFARLLYWGVRRELWENRSITIAPFAAAGLLVLAALIVAAEVVLNANMPNVNVGTDMDHNIALGIPYLLIAVPVLGIGVIVAAAYCLGALHGERQDRSILFWKSLPVSDLTTVLSKACIPLLLVPLVSFVAAVVMQLVVFAITLIVFPLFAAKAHLVWAGMPVNSGSVPTIWAGTPIGTLTLGMLYGLLATTLWQAPVYAWLLLVGGWAKRMSFVWAVAPVGGLMLAERIIFGTDRLATIVAARFDDNLWLAFNFVGDDRLPQLTPIRFIADPGLWIGLGVAALFLGAAVLLRRYRQPI